MSFLYPFVRVHLIFSMRGTADQGGDGVLIVLEQFFGRLLVLTILLVSVEFASQVLLIRRRRPA